MPLVLYMKEKSIDIWTETVALKLLELEDDFKTGHFSTITHYQMLFNVTTNLTHSFILR